MPKRPSSAGSARNPRKQLQRQHRGHSAKSIIRSRAVSARARIAFRTIPAPDVTCPATPRTHRPSPLCNRHRTQAGIGMCLRSPTAPVEENGIILENAKRWPLMIDPQRQANKFVRVYGKTAPQGLSVCKPSDSLASTRARQATVS